MPDINVRDLTWSGQLTKRDKTDLLVLHHAAASQCSIEDVHKWHLAKGWLGCGYQYFVRKDGSIWRGRPEDTVGAHCEGYNDHSIGVCAEGDFEAETMPVCQREAIVAMVRWILGKYPGMAVMRHSDLNNTLCPGKYYPFAEIAAEASSGTPILGKARATVAQAQGWAKARGAARGFVDLAPLYWREAPGRGAVRPEVAYSQAAKETAFGRFGGVIAGPEWHNWCGLKTTIGGDNSDPNAHARFSDDLTGIWAHLDHLALYAGAEGYPRTDTLDPRHFSYLEGTAPTVEQLSGKWAGAGYGESIVKNYLDGLLGTPEFDVPTEDSEKDLLRQEVARLQSRIAELTAQVGVLTSHIEQAKAVLVIES